VTPTLAVVSQDVVNLTYVVAAILFVVGIRLLSSPAAQAFDLEREPRPSYQKYNTGGENRLPVW
jgi:hypothetical protein